MDQVPAKQQLVEAANRIEKHIHRTPLISCDAINQWAGLEVLLKCENLQKVGAFKARGGMNAVKMLLENEAVDAVATHSSGNHAQALARAAKVCGIKAYIVMPRTAPEVKKNAVRGYGAEIIECEPTLEARETTLEQVVMNTQAHVVHPYDDYRVIAGQATAAMEMLEQEPFLKSIVTPVGGGGLLSGTILACTHFGQSVKVYAGEPAGADDAFRSLKSNKLIPSTNPDTIADGLLTSLGVRNFEIIRKGVTEIITVTDEEILEAMMMLWERAKLVVEPSGAVSLAAVRKSADQFSAGKVGVILSGGNTDVREMLRKSFN